MKNIKFLLLITLSLFVFSSCDDDETGTEYINYIGFEGKTFDFPVDVGSTNVYDVAVYTTQISGSDRTISVQVDVENSTADPYSFLVPTTVTIPAGSNKGLLSVSVSDINIGGGGETLVIEFAPTDGLLTGESITLNISQVCDYPVSLDIIFDGYASEVTWEIYDDASDLIASGGPWEDGDAFYSKSFCLADGTYEFVIYDAYGDGLSWPTNGSATISHKEVDLLEFVGDYGSQASGYFTISN